MSLETDINLPQFRNDYQKSVVNILYTHNWVIEQLKPIYGSSNLTKQQYNILAVLRNSPTPLSTMQLRACMLDKMSDTSRIVDRLVIKGLAKKIVSKKDKRLVDITITPKGAKLIERFDGKEEEMDSIASALSPAEAKTLNKLLDKIRNRVKPV
ncbi:MAG: MarR family transcriptional regulator [Sphingobacteriales bacterium]|nr:MarR family transcriptional regulator [Sphingobacteriales bacterium]